jgi:hypothetical protein
MQEKNQATLEFHIFHAARVMARGINQKRDLIRFPGQAIEAGQLDASRI